MSKRTKTIGPLVLMPILALSGCGEDIPQKDVYTGKDAQEALNHCAEDWGSNDLCTEITDPEQLKSLQSRCSEDEDGNETCSVDTNSHYAYGPQYMSRHRTVTHNSFVYVPMSVVTPGYRSSPIGNSSFSRSGSTFSRSVGFSRGGFGSTGARVSGFGGS